jgi:uncharacterized protein with HEPN domain
MSRRATDYLHHILDEVRYVLDRASIIKKEEFLQDPTLKRAFVRSMEIIGEASRQIPQDFTARHPEIDWKGMAGMRDRLIHGYFGVDYDLVWDVVKNKLPDLGRQVQSMLRTEE